MRAGGRGLWSGGIFDAWEGKVMLAGDVGATKILLEVGEARSGRWESAHSRRYATGEAANFPAQLKEFLSEWQASAPGSEPPPPPALGRAGPAPGHPRKEPHPAWQIE